MNGEYAYLTVIYVPIYIYIIEASNENICFCE